MVVFVEFVWLVKVLIMVTSLVRQRSLFEKGTPSLSSGCVVGLSPTVSLDGLFTRSEGGIP